MRKIIWWTLIIIGVIILLRFFGCWPARADMTLRSSITGWTPMETQELAEIGIFLAQYGCVVAVKDGRINQTDGTVAVKVLEIDTGETCLYMITTSKDKPNLMRIDRHRLKEAPK